MKSYKVNFSTWWVDRYINREETIVATTKKDAINKIQNIHPDATINSVIMQ